MTTEGEVMLTGFVYNGTNFDVDFNEDLSGRTAIITLKDVQDLLISTSESSIWLGVYRNTDGDEFTADILARAQSDVETFLGSGCFQPSQVIIVTWDMVFSVGQLPVVRHLTTTRLHLKKDPIKLNDFMM